MTLFDTVKQNQLAARKSRDALASTLLTTFIGEILAAAKKDGNREVCDADVVATAKKFIDNMNDTLGFLGLSNPEATEVVIRERAILSAYMPQQMSDDDLRAEVEKIIAVVGKNMGAVMAALKANFAGRYDGKAASTIVKSLL